VQAISRLRQRCCFASGSDTSGITPARGLPLRRADAAVSVRDTRALLLVHPDTGVEPAPGFRSQRVSTTLGADAGRGAQIAQTRQRSAVESGLPLREFAAVTGVTPALVIERNGVMAVIHARGLSHSDARPKAVVLLLATATALSASSCIPVWRGSFGQAGVSDLSGPFVRISRSTSAAGPASLFVLVPSS
jgi:hypothetical protein